MKRLLCLISNMNVGGAETFMMKLYRIIDRRQYQIDFCVNVLDENYYEKEIISMGGKVFKIPSRKESAIEHNRLLKKIFIQNQYKYALAISSSATCFIDMKIAKECGVEKCSVRSSNSSFGNSFIYKIIHTFFKKYYIKYVDTLISPSDIAAISLFGVDAINKGKVIFLHNAIDYKTFKYSDRNKEIVRKKLNILPDTVVMGHVGRFNTQKNHKRLIEIFNDYHKKNPNSKLLLIGIGNQMDLIRSQVGRLGLSNVVIFCGLRNDVSVYLSAMDIFVMPSFFEGMPNVVIEAQANGLPCIISDTITREANITGLVSYIPLDEGNERWVKAIESSLQTKRVNTEFQFHNKGYCIEEVANKFVEIVY